MHATTGQTGSTGTTSDLCGPITFTTCSCSNDPIYNNFPHPLHTPASFAVFNFLNNGMHFPIYITVTATADMQMQIDSNGAYRAGFTYCYLDAHPLQSIQLYSFTFPENLSARGRIAGGRIFIYYDNPSSIDPNRPSTGYPISQNGMFIPLLNDNDQPISPTIDYSQLLEFTIDRLTGQTQSFIDYDISYVDNAALPVYIYGGYDPSNQPGQQSCNKSYSACPSLTDFYSGCPTTPLINQANGAGQCLGSYSYCARAENVTKPYCEIFDDLVADYGITPQFLQQIKDSGGPDVTTPTNVVYGCNGEFLLDNKCIFPNYATQLTRDQCAALNRGVCFTPDYNQQLIGTCPGARPPPQASTCNSTTTPTYPSTTMCNKYARYIRSKGVKYYGFSQDEGNNGGNQQCRYSTQLDVVAFPSCG